MTLPVRARRRRGGMTMVEIMVSISLLAIASVMLLGAFWYTLRLDATNRERLWAREECQRQLETLYAMPFSDLAAYCATNTSNNGVDPIGKDSPLFAPTTASFDVKTELTAGGTSSILLLPSAAAQPPQNLHVGLISIEGGDPGKGNSTVPQNTQGNGDCMCYLIRVNAKWVSTVQKQKIGGPLDTHSYTLFANIANY